jgi:hypothetical protein
MPSRARSAHLDVQIGKTQLGTGTQLDESECYSEQRDSLSDSGGNFPGNWKQL